MTEITTIPGDVEAWRVGETEFVHGAGPGSTPERFYIQKDQSLMDLYAELCPDFRHSRIVELGIAAGGSAALLALLTSPAKLVACDIAASPAPALAGFIERHGLADVVRPYYGIDQADRGQLTEILDRELGGQAIDLVIDDASHLWDKTVASFEVLFPLVRPGGMFIIEDWSAQYLIAQEIAEVRADPTSRKHEQAKAHYEEAVRGGATPRPPLARLGVELLLVAAASSEVITQVTANRHWLAVRRGPATLDPDAFRLADLYSDHFGWLAEEPGEWWYRRMWET